ncbi:MAG TPA: 3-oxoacyl-ACP reductase family protein [Pyrinomonadaceae bacterium]
MNLADLQLHGRVAIVTGGSRGIGRAVVELLAELGAHVVVNYLSGKEAAESTVNAAQLKGVESISFQTNVANPLEAQRLIDTTIQRFKRIDILVCNAGIWLGAPVEEITEDLWNKTIDINLKGTWTVCRAVVPVMKKQRSGKIVILSSTAAQRGEANYSNYAASKGGQLAFTKSLAAELGPWGINVNAVAAGWVDTDMTVTALRDDKQRQSIASTIPLGKIAAPGDIATPVVFLCSDWAGHITGEVLNVNGGSVLSG